MAFVSSSILVKPSFQRASLCHNSFSGARVSTTTVPTSARFTMAGKIYPVFTQAMEDYKTDFPAFAKRGWGATVKAERWNGRHAMFGFVMLVATAYAKGHGLIPDAEVPLDFKQWGILSTLGDQNGISTERAVILVAHIHVLFVSVAAALAPFSFQDKLLLEPGEKDEEPAGLIPPLQFGLNKNAEIWNSRVAMLGIMIVVGIAVSTGTDVLDVINIGLGKILY